MRKYGKKEREIIEKESFKDHGFVLNFNNRSTKKRQYTRAKIGKKKMSFHLNIIEIIFSL